MKAVELDLELRVVSMLRKTSLVFSRKSSWRGTRDKTEDISTRYDPAIVLNSVSCVDTKDLLSFSNNSLKNDTAYILKVSLQTQS